MVVVVVVVVVVVLEVVVVVVVVVVVSNVISNISGFKSIAINFLQLYHRMQDRFYQLID